MHTGRSYRLPEFLVWTRRKIYVLALLDAVPVALYELAGRFRGARPSPQAPATTAFDRRRARLCGSKRFG